MCLTIVSFLCRSFIPVGYMPDTSGERDDGYAITFCVAGGGTHTVLMDLTGDPQDPSPDAPAGIQECPFGLIAAQAVMPGQAALAWVGLVLQHPLPLLHRNQALPPLPALGPPLGSRAPPSHLA